MQYITKYSRRMCVLGIVLIALCASFFGCGTNTTQEQQMTQKDKTIDSPMEAQETAGEDTQDTQDTQTNPSAGGRIRIVTTAFPPYDFARALAGEEAEITMLLKPGAEAHSYEPTPQDLIAIQSCDFFLYIGGESEAWVEQLLSSLEQNDMQVLALSDCVEGLAEEITEGMDTGSDGHTHVNGNASEEMDEHVWTSPKNVMLMSREITRRLQKIRPQKMETFEKNLEKYIQELSDLDASIHAVCDGKTDTPIFVGDRFPFRYLAKEYRLTYYAAFPGCSSESEPSAATMVFLTEKMKEKQAKVVFSLALGNGKIADTLSEQTGARKEILYSCHNISKEDFEAGETYISLMKKNAESLKKAFE